MRSPAINVRPSLPAIQVSIGLSPQKLAIALPLSKSHTLSVLSHDADIARLPGTPPKRMTARFERPAQEWRAGPPSPKPNHRPQVTTSSACEHSCGEWLGNTDSGRDVLVLCTRGKTMCFDEPMKTSRQPAENEHGAAAEARSAQEPQGPTWPHIPVDATCPECGSSMLREGHCWVCREWGFSKCG